MTRIKKTRTEKSIGAAKKPLEKKPQSQSRLAKKKGKGRPAGAKANIDGANQKAKPRKKTAADDKDLRVGSKKAISLVDTPAKAPMKPKVKLTKIKAKPVAKAVTPEQELEQLEADERLNELLDRLDNDQAISEQDQAYVAKQTARHQQLLVELDLAEDENEEQDKQEQDIWDRFDDSELDEYRDL